MYNIPAMFSGSLSVAADSKFPQNGPKAYEVDTIPITRHIKDWL